MKNLLIGTAMVFVYMIILTMSFDSKMYLEQLKEVKLISKELSATGSLFLDYEEFAQGRIKFNDEESIKAIDAQIKDFMALDENNKPINGVSYWQDTVEYMTYFYDDIGSCKVYKDGTYLKTINFSYPYLHEDDLGEYKKTVVEPTIITIIKAGKPRFRLQYFSDQMAGINVIKSSSYNWSEHN